MSPVSSQANTAAITVGAEVQPEANYYFDREPGKIYLPPRRPSVALTDTHGTVKIEFLAENITVGAYGAVDFKNIFITNNVPLDNNLIANDANTSIIRQNVINNVLNLIHRGDITCSGGDNIFTVSVDTSVTSATSSVGIGDGLIVQNMIFAPKLTPEQIAERKRRQFRDAIKQKMAPAIINHLGDRPRSLAPGADFGDASKNEIVALHLLRSMVDADVFKKYLKHGFITIKGPSGLTYQIQRKSHIVKVWNNGTLLSTLCVYVDNTYGIPPTDDVVAKMLICQNDETGIWRRANIGWRQAADEFTRLKDISEEHLAQMMIAKHLEEDPGGRNFFRVAA